MKDEGLEELEKTFGGEPGILGKEEYYFNSAIAVALVELGREYYFLFEKRAAGVKQAGEICFPGGQHDPELDDNYRQTAVRETVEELGVAREKINVLGRLDTLVAPMGATVDAFVLLLDLDDLSELDVDEEEVAEVFAIPVSSFEAVEPEEYGARLEIKPKYLDEDGEEKVLLPAERLGLPERYQEPWGGKRYRVFVYDIDDRIIWGITAQVIREITGILAGA